MKWLHIICVVIIMLNVFFHGCAPNTEQNKEIIAVIYENIAAIEAEDLDRYMATIHEQSPAYATTREMMEQITNAYDLKYELKEAKIIKRSAEEASVQFIQVTTRLSGPEFRDNKIKGVHILKKSEDKWKIFNTEVKDIEYLN